jgi:hypothetical protein
MLDVRALETANPQARVFNSSDARHKDREERERERKINQQLRC